MTGETPSTKAALAAITALTSGRSAFVVLEPNPTWWGDPPYFRRIVVKVIENTAALGMLLYTKYVFLFQAAGLILLVAMIGAIVLTLRKRAWVKRQDVLRQMYRDPKAAVELRDIKPGQGA